MNFCDIEVLRTANDDSFLLAKSRRLPGKSSNTLNTGYEIILQFWGTLQPSSFMLVSFI